MSNLTANILREPVGPAGYSVHIAVADATHIYEGGLVSQLTSGGKATPFSTASSSVCVGMATHEADNSGSTSKRVLVETRRAFLIKNGSNSDAFTDTDQLGSLVFGSDDHTAAKTNGSNLYQAIGFFLGLHDSGKVIVFIDPIRARAFQLIASLTDNTSGSADSTLAALPTLTDSPATADALRDDINTNLYPVLKNNFADLAAKVNAILAVLQS